MRRVPLRNRRGEVTAFALVDEADYERVIEAGPWSRQGGYVVHSGRADEDGIRLHRFILGLGPGDPHVDHVDRDPMNNQRANLRSATKAQNAQNLGVRSDNSSGERGVFWHKRAGKWQAQATLDGKHHYLGLHAELDDAVAAVRQWRAEHMPFSIEALEAAHG